VQLAATDEIDAPRRVMRKRQCFRCAEDEQRQTWARRAVCGLRSAVCAAILHACRRAALAPLFAPNPSSQRAAAPDNARCTMTKARLVPCSIAAPPWIPRANVHRQVTRASQCVAVAFALCIGLPLQLPCRPRAVCYPRPCASLPMRSPEWLPRLAVCSL
jgi:hypothetical protein